jgi:hypothetical protein
MPQAAISAIANFFLAVTGAYSAAATAYALFAAKVFVYAASTYLLNRAAASMAPKSRGSGLGQGMEINYYDSGAPIRIVYGQVRTGGMETIPPLTSGGDNAFLHKVITLAGHEVDSYNFTHFDTTTITNAQIGAVSFTGSDGKVSSGYYGDHVWLRRYRGTSTDSADRMLMAVDSSAFNNARARGIAKVAVTLKFNGDVFRSIPTMTFTYQGKRCYDPRLDTSPGANPTNTSYIAWTQNPALCLCDYLMGVYGGEYSAGDIDWDSVVTAANYCDVTVSTPAGSQARYTCNGVLLATDSFESNVRMLVDSMLGRIIFRDGKWRVFAGSWQTPSYTIEKSDWLEGGLSIRFEQGRQRRFNRMRCWYVDKARDWQRVECNPRYNTTYKAADGAEDIDAETEQLMCTGEHEAQRKAEFLLRQSRNQITVTGRLPPRFQNMALWDTGFIVFDHLGWSTKTFRCVGIDLNPDGSLDCVFNEEQSTDWTDMASGEYNAPSIATLPPVNDPVYPVAPGALQMTLMVSCLTSQVFSGAGAFNLRTVAQLDISPSSLDYNADVHATAQYRTGLQNINNYQNITLRMASGPSSSFVTNGFSVGGSPANMQPQTQIGQFVNARNSSCAVLLFWDAASGANSFTLDQVTLKVDVYRRRLGYI